jgi:hypothetical protein
MHTPARPPRPQVSRLGQASNPIEDFRENTRQNNGLRDCSKLRRFNNTVTFSGSLTNYGQAVYRVMHSLCE